MWRNYLLVAWRNFKKDRIFSSINILGLAAGLGFALIVLSYGWQELRVNQKLRNADRQYIIQSKWKDPNMGLEFTSLAPMAKTLAEQYPHIVSNYYRFDGISSALTVGNKSFREGIQLGDSTLLEMFGFELLYGNKQEAWANPNSVVLTDEKAMKLFGTVDVLGEAISIENFIGERQDFLVTGVMKAPHQNSVTHFNENNENHVFISNSASDFFGRNMDEWTNAIILNYLELKAGVNPKAVLEPMNQLIATHCDERIQANLKPYLVPLQRYYVESNGGPIKQLLRTLGAAALFILIMAVINFVNISISKAHTRMREIGVRKVLGGRRKELIFQFYMESLLWVTISACISVLFYPIWGTLFEYLLNKELVQIWEFPVALWFIYVGVVFAIGILAGTYPALFISGFKSVHTLKGQLQPRVDRLLLRKGLVGFQFLTAAIVLTCALIISAQIQFFFQTDLGYDKSLLVSAQVPRDWSAEGLTKMERIRQQFNDLPEIEYASVAYQIPDGLNGNQISTYKVGRDSSESVSAELLFADEYYAKTLAIPMVAGTFFNKPGQAIDTTGVVINESQARALGWSDPKDAVNQRIRLVNDPNTYTIRGVVKNYHFGSKHDRIHPVLFINVLRAPIYRYLTFRFLPGDITASLAALDREWSKLLPGNPLDFVFMDDKLEKLYRNELQLEKASYAATGLAFVIALLGIFGLVAYTINQRTKEFGIRKIVGASGKHILVLLFSDFLPLICSMALLSIPIVYWMMSQWLASYYYHIHIGVTPFIITLIVITAATLSLICLQSLKAIFINPVEVLRLD